MQDLVFGTATDGTSWQDAIDDCLMHGMLPASAAQVWAFRIETDGRDDVRKQEAGYATTSSDFVTSTAAIYFRDKSGRPQVALYDTQANDGKDNILIARAQEACELQRVHGSHGWFSYGCRHLPWLVSLDDSLLAGMIADAQRRGRIVTPGVTSNPLSAFRDDPNVIAALGSQQLTTDVQRFIQHQRIATRYNSLLSLGDVSSRDLTNGYADVRQVVVPSTTSVARADAIPLAARIPPSDVTVRGVRREPGDRITLDDLPRHREHLMQYE